MQVENVLKVIDIDHNELLAELKQLLKQRIPTYKDQYYSEHLYSVDDILDSGSSNLSPKVQKQLQEISGLMRMHDAGYFRIVY